MSGQVGGIGHVCERGVCGEVCIYDVRGHPVSGDVRRQIAEALCEHHGGPEWWTRTDDEERESYLRDADALLLVVDRIARQRAAKELREAAEQCIEWKQAARDHRGEDGYGDPLTYIGVAGHLMVRADALTAEPQP